MCKPIERSELLMLQKMYLDIKIIASQLVEFEEKHTFAKAVKESLDKCVHTLDQVAHELCFDAFKIKQDNFKDGKTETGTDQCCL